MDALIIDARIIITMGKKNEKEKTIMRTGKTANNVNL